MAIEICWNELHENTISRRVSTSRHQPTSASPATDPRAILITTSNRESHTNTLIAAGVRRLPSLRLAPLTASHSKSRRGKIIQNPTNPTAGPSLMERVMKVTTTHMVVALALLLQRRWRYCERELQSRDSPVAKCTVGCTGPDSGTVSVRDDYPTPMAPLFATMYTL